MLETGIYTGEVIWYNDRRSYGFVRIDKDEIFIHRTILTRFGLDFLYSGDEIRGVVKFFNPLEGYGFIEIVDDPDMSDEFIHSRTLQACVLRTIAEGQPLLLHVSDDGKGPQATEVRILSVD